MVYSLGYSNNNISTLEILYPHFEKEFSEGTYPDLFSIYRG
jgi:hypothetical protein